MKHLILALALVAPLAYADQERCTKVGGIAMKIMEARQVGVPLSDMMQIAGDSELMQRITLDAYEKPRYSSERYQNNAINDFRSEWELTCYKVMRGGA